MPLDFKAIRLNQPRQHRLVICRRLDRDDRFGPQYDRGENAEEAAIRAEIHDGPSLKTRLERRQINVARVHFPHSAKSRRPILAFNERGDLANWNNDALPADTHGDIRGHHAVRRNKGAARQDRWASQYEEAHVSREVGRIEHMGQLSEFPRKSGGGVHAEGFRRAGHGRCGACLFKTIITFPSFTETAARRWRRHSPEWIASDSRGVEIWPAPLTLPRRTGIAIDLPYRKARALPSSPSAIADRLEGPFLTTNFRNHNSTRTMDRMR